MNQRILRVRAPMKRNGIVRTNHRAPKMVKPGLRRFPEGREPFPEWLFLHHTQPGVRNGVLSVAVGGRAIRREMNRAGLLFCGWGPESRPAVALLPADRDRKGGVAASFCGRTWRGNRLGVRDAFLQELAFPFRDLSSAPIRRKNFIINISMV